MITVKCYGEERKWENRQDAINYYFEGVVCSEGSEQNRYSNVLAGLFAGLNYVTDGE